MAATDGKTVAAERMQKPIARSAGQVSDAPNELLLWLLPSGPDQVRGSPVRRAQPTDHTMGFVRTESRVTKNRRSPRLSKQIVPTDISVGRHGSRAKGRGTL